MEIHHYTTIENLALILKNKTIRFSRLDTVDDGSEADFSCLGIKPSLYKFVSCWTYLEEESISLWKMYSGKTADGIMISVDSEILFDLINVPNEDGTPSLLYSCTDEDNVFTDERIILLFEKEDFAQKVKYLEYPNKTTYSQIQAAFCNKKSDEIFIAVKKYGFEKHKIWEFQNEYRYAINIIPLNEKNSLDRNQRIREVKKMFYNIGHKIPCNFVFYDMPISSKALKNMKITIGPKCTEAQEAIVKSLVKTFANNLDVKRSILTGIIKK